MTSSCFLILESIFQVLLRMEEAGTLRNSRLKWRIRDLYCVLKESSQNLMVREALGEKK